jgi:hypothetical protein
MKRGKIQMTKITKKEIRSLTKKEQKNLKRKFISDTLSKYNVFTGAEKRQLRDSGFDKIALYIQEKNKQLKAEGKKRIAEKGIIKDVQKVFNKFDLEKKYDRLQYKPLDQANKKYLLKYKYHYIVRYEVKVGGEKLERFFTLSTIKKLSKKDVIQEFREAFDEDNRNNYQGEELIVGSIQIVEAYEPIK